MDDLRELLEPVCSCGRIVLGRGEHLRDCPVFRAWRWEAEQVREAVREMLDSLDGASDG